QEHISLDVRVLNAVNAYVRYIADMLYPTRLAAFYPHPVNGLPLGEAAAAGFVLAAISFWCFRAGNHHPYLLVGRLLYVGARVPVIGLVQVGAQARADRYTYVPLIGLFLMIAWGGAELMAGWAWRRMVLSGGAAAVVVACAAGTWTQASYWRNSV